MNTRLLSITLAMVLLTICIVQKTPALDPNNQPTPFDIVMMAGADYDLALNLKSPFGGGIYLADKDYVAQFRSAASPGGVLFARFSTATFNSYSARPSQIPYVRSGYIYLRLPAATTRQLSGKSGLWDLLQINSLGRIRCMMSGKAIVRPTTTVLP